MNAVEITLKPYICYTPNMMCYKFIEQLIEKLFVIPFHKNINVTIVYGKPVTIIIYVVLLVTLNVKSNKSVYKRDPIKIYLHDE